MDDMLTKHRRATKNLQRAAEEYIRCGGSNVVLSMGIRSEESGPKPDYFLLLGPQDRKTFDGHTWVVSEPS